MKSGRQKSLVSNASCHKSSCLNHQIAGPTVYLVYTEDVSKTNQGSIFHKKKNKNKLYMYIMPMYNAENVLLIIQMEHYI